MNRVALVTGAAGGIGRSIVARLVTAGYQVVAGDLAQVLEQSALGSQPGTTPITLDVRDPASVDSAVGAACEVGRLQALVNCAGTLRSSSLEEVADHDLSFMWEVNVAGAVRVCAAAARLSRELQAIVNIGSIASRLGRLPGIAGYSATKRGLAAFTQALAYELGPKGIRVNLVEPGFIAVPMSNAMRAVSGGETSATRIVPLGRMGTPDEVAEVTEFLLSQRASYVHGAVIVVDGGASAG